MPSWLTQQMQRSHPARSPLAIGGGLGLVLLHLGLIGWVTGNGDQLVLSLVFWVAIATHLWQSPRPPQPTRSMTRLGLALLGLLVALSGVAPQLGSPFVRLFPGLALLGWGLVVLGGGVRSHRTALGLTLALMLPPNLLPWLLEPRWGEAIQATTAWVAAFLLHFLGFEVAQQSTLITLPDGAVQVEFRCTGVLLAGLLLQVVILIGLVNPPGRWLKRGGFAIALAFGLSCLRVAIMALCVDQVEWFRYWHGYAGNQIFTTAALVILGLVTLRPTPPGSQVAAGDCPTPTPPLP